jgi:purine-nucleoside/S-methyl-5'-thioadenosine phosphorylase / adenosine deaminase
VVKISTAGGAASDPRTEAAGPPIPELPSPFAWRGAGDVAWIEAPLPGARAAFSTRLGGSSQGAYRSLNLGILTEDDPDLVARNRRKLALALGREPETVAMGWQVHGAEVQRHTQRPAESGYARRGTELARVDAQVTGHLEVTPIVLAADCVPLALGVPGAAASVHCGWRGVAAGIVQRAIEVCCELSGAEPHDLGAAVGPAIGRCCYEVGDEVRKAFASRGHGSDVLEGGRLDLPLAVRRELERTGVRSERIADVALCTSCRQDLFFSHRRDGGVTGRQAGLAWRKP